MIIDREIQSDAALKLLPSGFTTRTGRLEDIEMLVPMLNAAAMDIIGVAKHSVDDIRGEWLEPGFNPETNTRLVFDLTGRLAGYYEVFDPGPPHVQFHVWGQVHPDFTRMGIGANLLDWAESRARQLIPLAPPDARVIVTAYVPTIHQYARELFLNAGYQPVRYALRMVIDLDAPPADPIWPGGIVVRPMQVGKDEEAIVVADREAFRDHWGIVERPLETDLKLWRHRMDNDPRFDPSLWFVAWDGDKIAGISLCYPWWFDDHDLGWVGTLGVLRPWRRRGLGLALLQHSFGELYRRGKRKVGLGVDANSLTGATRLYLKAGMRPDPNREFVLFHKELRPGIDLATRTVEE